MAATAGLSLTLDPMGKVSQNTSSQLSFSNKLYICEPRLRMQQQPNCTILHRFFICGLASHRSLTNYMCTKVEDATTT